MKIKVNFYDLSFNEQISLLIAQNMIIHAKRVKVYKI